MAAFGSAFGSRTTAAPTAAAAHPHNPNNDMEVVTPQDDSISSLNFSPKSNHLVATSWDNQARLLAGPRPLLHTKTRRPLFVQAICRPNSRGAIRGITRETHSGLCGRQGGRQPLLVTAAGQCTICSSSQTTGHLQRKRTLLQARSDQVIHRSIRTAYAGSAACAVTAGNFNSDAPEAPIRGKQESC